MTSKNKILTFPIILIAIFSIFFINCFIYNNVIAQNALPPNLISALNKLDSGNKIQKDNALRQLGKSNNPDLVYYVIPLLNNDDALTRQYAARLLGILQSPEALKPLINTLEDTNTEVIRESAIALYYIGDTSACESLVKLLDSSNESIRITATVALATCGTNYAVPFLISALETDKSLQVKRNAAYDLGKIGDKRAISHLLPFIDAGDKELRENVGLALAMLGEPLARPLLVEIMHSRDSYKRHLAVQLLKTLEIPNTTETNYWIDRFGQLADKVLSASYTLLVLETDDLEEARQTLSDLQNRGLAAYLLPQLEDDGYIYYIKLGMFDTIEEAKNIANTIGGKTPQVIEIDNTDRLYLAPASYLRVSEQIKIPFYVNYTLSWANPKWSPNEEGFAIILNPNTEGRLLLVDLIKNRIGLFGHHIKQFAWSYDGSMIAFAERDLYSGFYDDSKNYTLGIAQIHSMDARSSSLFCGDSLAWTKTGTILFSNDEGHTWGQINPDGSNFRDSGAKPPENNLPNWNLLGYKKCVTDENGATYIKDEEGNLFLDYATYLAISPSGEQIALLKKLQIGTYEIEFLRLQVVK